MLPTDAEYGSPRLKAYNKRNNDVARENTLNQLEKARNVALLHFARYQQSLQRYHDKHVHRQDLNVGDLVSGEARITRDDTSLLRHGKGCTSSQKY
jgi:hypothetical protein